MTEKEKEWMNNWVEQMMIYGQVCIDKNTGEVVDLGNIDFK